MSETQGKLPEEIQEILDKVETDIKENTNLLERITYMILLYNTLRLLKEGIGESVKAYYNQLPRTSKLAMSFTNGTPGYLLYELTQAVFSILAASHEYYGDEYRQINGTRLGNIDGIDFSCIGIPAIIPRVLPQLEGGISTSEVVTIKLEQLEEVRLSEFQSVGAMAHGDSGKVELVKKVIANEGGISLNNMFKD